jgi:hypothetical protein
VRLEVAPGQADDCPERTPLAYPGSHETHAPRSWFGSGRPGGDVRGRLRGGAMPTRRAFGELLHQEVPAQPRGKLRRDRGGGLGDPQGAEDDL